ncbi:hypothetical protein NQ315_001513 [Exocentrus adspersus]|uniref:Uncharacterized protein n=1 Tax=Exocentrus adspersus TaxID=1586481 RepID=A0AAV8W8I9_9CUCU|nr:hypothetical protein NQ315_001513 [Exocentrus adspersus]
MTQNRKRRRSLREDEVEVEFMPLSKRINNLHINNTMLLDSSSGERSTPIWSSMNQLPDSPPSSEQSLDWNMSQFPLEYSPDLNENQNPHYFNINKLLFEMYLQRVQRGCHQI